MESTHFLSRSFPTRKAGGKAGDTGLHHQRHSPMVRPVINSCWERGRKHCLLSQTLFSMKQMPAEHTHPSCPSQGPGIYLLLSRRGKSEMMEEVGSPSFHRIQTKIYCYQTRKRSKIPLPRRRHRKLNILPTTLTGTHSGLSVFKHSKLVLNLSIFFIEIIMCLR